MEIQELVTVLVQSCPSDTINIGFGAFVAG